MKKYIAIGIAIFIALTALPKVAFGEELSPTDKLKEYDFSLFEEFFDAVNESFEDGSFLDLVERLLSGEVDVKGFFSLVIGTAFSGLTELLPLLGLLTAIALIYGVLGNMRGDLLSDEIQSAIRFAFAIAVATLLSSYAARAFEKAGETIKNLEEQMLASFPFLLTLTFAGGGETTATVLQPILYFLSVTLSGVIASVVFPLSVFSFATGILSRLCDKIDFSRISKTAKDVSTFILVASLVIFTAYLSISGAFSINRDSAAYKTARYALSQGVPIVGQYLREGIDMVVLCSVEIKNAVGIAALLILVATVLSPVVFLYGLCFVLRIAAAISSPFSDEKFSDFIALAAESFESVGASLLCVVFMYIEAVFTLIVATRFVL